MDLFKTKRSPARGWLLVLGALTLVGAAALLSSCSAGEDEPVDEEHAISVRPGKKTLKSPEDVEEELKGKGETITLTIDKEYENAPGGTWERLLQIIETYCKKEDADGSKDEDEDEDAVEDADVWSLPDVYKNGIRYWFPEAKKFVKLDLSATSLAVYGDRDNDGIYDGDNDGVYNYNYDDFDNYDGFVVFDPRNPVHTTLAVAQGSIVGHEPYGYVFNGTKDDHPGTGEPYITELTLPDKATAIAGTRDPYNTSGWTATFTVFTRLKKVTANGVEIINEYAFYDCGNALEEASFPKVTSIGLSAFDGCGELTRLFLPAAPPELRPSAQECNLFTIYSPRDDTLFIYVNGDKDEDAVAEYVKEWDVGTASVGASSTKVYGLPFYYHKPVTIMPLK